MGDWTVFGRVNHLGASPGLLSLSHPSLGSRGEYPRKVREVNRHIAWYTSPYLWACCVWIVSGWGLACGDERRRTGSGSALEATMRYRNPRLVYCQLVELSSWQLCPLVAMWHTLKRTSLCAWQCVCVLFALISAGTRWIQDNPPLQGPRGGGRNPQRLPPPDRTSLTSVILTPDRRVRTTVWVTDRVETREGSDVTWPSWLPPYCSGLVWRSASWETWFVAIVGLTDTSRVVLRD